MGMFQTGKESTIALGRVTTDAVQRRLNKGSKEKQGKQDCSTATELQQQRCDYFCEECNQQIPGKEALKDHFKSVSHRQHAACVYCSKPVYTYKCKDKTEVYHAC